MADHLILSYTGLIRDGRPLQIAKYVASITACDPIPSKQNQNTSTLIDHDLFFDLENTKNNTYQLLTQASEGVSQPVLSHAICLVNVDEVKLNTQEHFDSDSVFFVCNNASTGHICNDASLFVGKLKASSRQLVTTTSSSICIQEGTVKLRLMDDDGKIVDLIISILPLVLPIQTNEVLLLIWPFIWYLYNYDFYIHNNRYYYYYYYYS